MLASERTSIAFVEKFMIFSHGELSDTENSFQRCFACFIHAHVNIVRRKSQGIIFPQKKEHKILKLLHRSGAINKAAFEVLHYGKSFLHGINDRVDASYFKAYDSILSCFQRAEEQS